MFSFDEKKKYASKHAYSNHCNGNYGPWFCDIGGIGTNSSILAENNGTENSGNSNKLDNYTKNYEMSGENHYTCVELEVYGFVK